MQNLNKKQSVVKAQNVQAHPTAPQADLTPLAEADRGSSVQRLVRQFWGFFFGYSCMCSDLEKVNKWLNKKAGIYRGLYDKKGKIHYSFDWPGLFGLTKYKVNLS